MRVGESSAGAPWLEAAGGWRVEQKVDPFTSTIIGECACRGAGHEHAAAGLKRKAFCSAAGMPKGSSFLDALGRALSAAPSVSDMGCSDGRSPSPARRSAGMPSSLMLALLALARASGWQEL